MVGLIGASEAVAFPHWHAHFDVLAVLGVITVAYLLAVRGERARRAAAAGADHQQAEPLVTRGQAACFTGAMLTLLGASTWPVHDVAEGYLYSVHMGQHLLLTLVVALLLVAGTPGWMARRIIGSGRRLAVVRSLTRMVPALVVFNLVLVLSHWPVVVEATVRFHALHFVAHAVLLSSAVLLWMPVLSPLPEVPRFRPPMQMIYLFLQTILPTVPASFLTFGTHPLYQVYADLPRLWGISAVTDQQVAGLLMKIVGGLYLWGAIVVIFFRWFQTEEAAGEGGADGGGDNGAGRDGAGKDDVLYWDDVEKELKAPL